MKNHYLIAAISFTILLLFGCELETELVVNSQAEQKILFKDDFSGDLSQWDISEGTWEIDNNKLRGIGHGGGIDAWIYAGNESWTDYEISFTAYFENGNAEIVLRSTGHWHDEYRVSVWPEEYGTTGDDYANTYQFSHYKNGVGYSYPDSLGKDHRMCPFSITNPAPSFHHF